MSLQDTSKIDEEHKKEQLIEKEKEKKLHKEIADEINPKQSRFKAILGNKRTSSKTQAKPQPSAEDINKCVNYNVADHDIQPVQSELVLASYSILSLPINNFLKCHQQLPKMPSTTS
jgi:hypothetical protein